MLGRVCEYVCVSVCDERVSLCQNRFTCFALPNEYAKAYFSIYFERKRTKYI